MRTHSVRLALLSRASAYAVALRAVRRCVGWFDTIPEPDTVLQSSGRETKTCPRSRFRRNFRGKYHPNSQEQCRKQSASPSRRHRGPRLDSPGIDSLHGTAVHIQMYTGGIRSQRDRLCSYYRSQLCPYQSVPIRPSWVMIIRTASKLWIDYLFMTLNYPR